MFALYIVVLGLLSYWLFTKTSKPKNFPPGPPRLPFLGSFPYLKGSGPKHSLLMGLTEQIKVHGPIIGFYFGDMPAVYLAEYQWIKEAFKMDSLSARPDISPSELVRPGYMHMNKSESGGTPGVIFSHGPYWRELRRFLLRNLRDFGFGKTSMENLFVEEMAKLNEVLSKEIGQPLNLSGKLNISIVNSLWSILTGEKLALNDANLQRVVDLVNQLIGSSSPLSPLVSILPSKKMGSWPGIAQLTGFSLAKKTFANVANMIEPFVDEHMNSLDEDNIRDFLDLMILEQKNTKNEASCFNSELGKSTIINSMIELFIAGMETTSTSLMIVILHLLHHPDIKEKVQNEIDQIIGRNRFPTMEDKEQMHYTNAVILESMRVGSLAYMGVPHAALEDVKLGNYTIPKGAIVFGGLYHAMHDPKLFENPDEFSPERFLNKSGEFIPDDRVIPFGTGKRFCLGQSLAEKEFFIFFTGMLQQFNIDPVPGKALPPYKDIYLPSEVLIRTPGPYEVILTKRY